MNLKSLFVRLFLGNLLINGIVVVVAGLVAYHSLNENYLRETEAYQRQVMTIACQYVEHVRLLNAEEVDRLCKQFPAGGGVSAAQGLPVRLTVIAADGRVLGDSLGDPAHMLNHKTPDRPEILDALAGRPGCEVRRSDTFQVQYRYMALPIHAEDAVVGAVRVAMPVVAMLESEAVLRDVLLWTAAVAIAGFALLGLLLNWFWFRPLKGIVEAGHAIAAGDLSRRVPVPDSEELARLAQALNAMRENFAAQIQTITAQRENLGQVVANLREGVIALDPQGRIVLMNQDAIDLLAPAAGAVTGQPLSTVVRAAGIIDAYNEALARQKPVKRQIEIEVRSLPRHLDVQASAMAAPGGAGLAGLIVVRDVTDLVRAASMKAEFVANASHELRTPLATLRAAVDSLEAEPDDAEFVRKIAGMLDRNLRRLESLTLALLDLHAVEDSKRPLRLERIVLGSLAEWLEVQFADRAAEKGVTMQFDVARAADVFTADRPLVELILQNLVDNAVKFTPAGGRVTCFMDRQDGRTVLRVSDSGCGIRREDRPRVFERFFQADPARSGDARTRGSGLGLAIVKHACERLGATVDLQSELGTGTTVTVVVPDRTAAAGPSGAAEAGGAPSDPPRKPAP